MKTMCFRAILARSMGLDGFFLFPQNTLSAFMSKIVTSIALLIRRSIMLTTEQCVGG
ncbi:hypothetical protein CI102_4337 [Trichoderma harzianum]|nr:hypothetical protein CI102_4337 [Trichoderma harzianum]